MDDKRRNNDREENEGEKVREGKRKEARKGRTVQVNGGKKKSKRKETSKERTVKG